MTKYILSVTRVLGFQRSILSMPLALQKNHALHLFESDLQQSNAHVGCVAESWFNDKISTNSLI